MKSAPASGAKGVEEVNFRTLLELQGVSGRDIDDAVRSARRVTRMASLASGLVATALSEASQKLANDRAKAIALKGAALAHHIHEDAEKMLFRGPR